MTKVSVAGLLLLAGVSGGAAAEAAEAAAEGVCRAGEACSGGDHMLMQVKHAKVSPHNRRERKDHPLGFPGTGHFVAESEWCRGETPATAWSLERCNTADADRPVEVKVMSYNLFWWNLYGVRHGNDGSAGKLIADHQTEEGKKAYYDVMLFQECDDVNRIMADARNAGLSGDYDVVQGGFALGIAYRSSRWSLLDAGVDEVAEDQPAQWYGNRGAQWARLEHKRTNKTLTVVNHHGPLPVNTGGKCGGQATAFNILHTVGTHAQAGDAVIVAGDFNAARNYSQTIPELEQRLHRVFTGVSMGGIDHIFSSSCTGSGRTLGLGGSDHEALDAKITI